MIITSDWIKVNLFHSDDYIKKLNTPIDFIHDLKYYQVKEISKKPLINYKTEIDDYFKKYDIDVIDRLPVESHIHYFSKNEFEKLKKVLNKNYNTLGFNLEHSTDVAILKHKNLEFTKNILIHELVHLISHTVVNLENGNIETQQIGYLTGYGSVKMHTFNELITNYITYEITGCEISKLCNIIKNNDITLGNELIENVSKKVGLSYDDFKAELIKGLLFNKNNKKVNSILKKALGMNYETFSDLLGDNNSNYKKMNELIKNI